MRCAHLLSSNKKCLRTSKSRSKYCWQHGGGEVTCKKKSNNTVDCTKNGKKYYCPSSSFSSLTDQKYRCVKDNRNEYYVCSLDPMVKTINYKCREEEPVEKIAFANYCNDPNYLARFSNQIFYKVFVTLAINKLNYNWGSGTFESFQSYIRGDDIASYLSPKGRYEHLTLFSFKVPTGKYSLTSSEKTTLVKNITTGTGYRFNLRGDIMKNKPSLNLRASHLSEIGDQGYVAIHFKKSPEYSKLTRQLFNLTKGYFGPDICLMYEGDIKAHLSIGRKALDDVPRIELDSNYDLNIPADKLKDILIVKVGFEQLTTDGNFVLYNPI